MTSVRGSNNFEWGSALLPNDPRVITYKKARESEIAKSTLSTRAKNCLWNNAFYTSGEPFLTFDSVRIATDEELLSCLGLGRKTLREIREYIATNHPIPSPNRDWLIV